MTTVAKKVLILESDEFYIEVIGTFVRLFLQYDFVPTKSVPEATQAVEQAKPDMILVDLDTDGQPATEFTEKMRDDCDTKSIPIIAIAQDSGMRDKALGARCNAFITKRFPKGSTPVEFCITSVSAAGYEYQPPDNPCVDDVGPTAASGAALAVRTGWRAA